MQLVMTMKRLNVWNSIYPNKSMTLFGKTCYKIPPMSSILFPTVIIPNDEAKAQSLLQYILGPLGMAQSRCASLLHLLVLKLGCMLESAGEG